jgi:hypothetical protein
MLIKLTIYIYILWLHMCWQRFSFHSNKDLMADIQYYIFIYIYPLVI